MFVFLCRCLVSSIKIKIRINILLEYKYYTMNIFCLKQNYIEFINDIIIHAVMLMCSLRNAPLSKKLNKRKINQ